MLTNYLPVEKYGLYSKIYNYTSIFVFLADLWLYTITIREISNNPSNTKKIIGNVMSLRLILWIIILFLSIFIAFFIPGYNSLLALLSIFITSLFTIFQLINSSILSLMQANMKVEFWAVSLVAWKLINLGLISLIAFYFYPKETILNLDYFSPFLWIMWAGLIWVIINTFLNYLYARRIQKFWFEFDFSYLKNLFKISLPYGIALFLSIVYFKVDIILLSIIEWPEKWDLSIALYSLPMKIVEVVMVLWWFYMTSMLPSLSKWFREKNTKIISNLTDISFKVMISFSFLVFTLGILFRDNIILIIANTDYLSNLYDFNSSDAFIIVFFSILFYFISLVFIYLLVASEKQSELLRINIIVTIFNIVWNLVLIPIYSFIWAGIITLLSQIILLLLVYYKSKEESSFRLPYLFIFRNIAFSSFVFIFWFFLINNFSISIIFDLIVYGFLLWFIYLLYFFYEYRRGIRKI